MKQLLIGLAALLAADWCSAQISVVPPTGIPARFPKADSELLKQTKPPSRNWLRDADDDRERFRRIELWSGAGDLEMQDIAHRFVELHAAIQQENWDIGIYHWEKIRGRMTIAAMKRPTRTQNMEVILFDSGTWKAMHDALTAKNAVRARTEFLRARESCMTCHVAEKIGFLNTSAVFARTATFP